MDVALEVEKLKHHQCGLFYQSSVSRASYHSKIESRFDFPLELEGVLDMPVWSKLEAGRIPQPPELFQIIDNHFKMNTGASSLSGGGGGKSPSLKDEL